MNDNESKTRERGECCEWPGPGTDIFSWSVLAASCHQVDQQLSQDDPQATYCPTNSQLSVN